MSGKVGLAAKLILATSTVAGGGSGAWYVTQNGLPTVASLSGSGSANAELEKQATTEASSFGAGDLEAVAGAWAEPTAPANNAEAKEATPESSPMARSAEASTPSAGDRYDAAIVMPVTPAETPAAEASGAEASGSSPELASTPSPAPEAQAVASEEALARGQEPKEEPNQLTPIVPAGPVATNDFIAADGASDDRYGGAAARTGESQNAGGGTELVNPFAAKPQAAAGEREATNTIEPLPASAHEDIGNQLSELQQPAANTRTAAANTLPTNNHDAEQSFAREREPRSLDSPFDAAPTEAAPIANAGGNGAPEAALAGAGRPGERALEGPQRPSLEIQKMAPPEIQVGKPAKFIVHVRNVGNQSADGVTVRDIVPEGTKLISTSPEAQTAGDALTWQLGKLSPGEDRTVEMQLMPTTEGEVGSVATVSYAAQASVKTRCTMPQLAIRMTAPSKVLVGQEQRVKIELKNPGSGDATGVMLFENVPQNVRHPAGPALEFEIGTLKAGETRELELSLFAEKPGKTINVLSAKAEGNLQVQQQVEFEVIAPALTVDVSGPERRYLERPAKYEISIENPGTAPAHDVQIVTKLPKGLKFIRANNYGEYDAANHAVYWSLTELPEGEPGMVELVAMPVETGPQTLAVEARAGQGLTDQAERKIVIDGLAAIMFEVRDLEDPIEVGGETGYEIRIVNQGTKAASKVQLAVTLPPGMKLVSAEGETQHADQRGVVLFEPIPQLAPKADSLYRLRVQGTQAGDQRVTVEVNTEDLAQPIRREESTRVFGDE